MLGTIFLLLSAGFGTILTYLTAAPLRLEERLFMGTAVGLGLSTLAVFAGSTIAGFSDATIAAVAAAMAIGSAIVLGRATVRSLVRGDVKDFLSRAQRWPFWLYVGVFGIFAALLTVLFTHALFLDGGTMYAGFSNIWGDWNQHLSQTTSFAYGHNIPPEMTTMSGQKLGYPFGTNFLSAILIKGGYSLLPAMKIPALILALTGLGLVMTFTRILAGEKAALLAPFIFYLSGGLGFINFFADLIQNSQPLGYFFAHLPHQYTLTWGDVPVPNISWINTVYAYLVPQRAFLFGLPLTLSVLVLLYHGLDKRQPASLLAAGLVASLLPLIHTHGLIFLGILTPGLIYLTRKEVAGRRKMSAASLSLWGYFIGPILVLALPQFLWLTTGVDAGRFFHPQFGWVKHEDEFFWFWLKNMALFLPLLLVSLIWLKRRYSLVRSFTLSSLIVFAVANLFVFQPWDWDNTKLLVYWFVSSIPAVLLLLLWLAKKSRAWKVTVAAMIVIMTLAGTIELSRAVQHPTARAEMFDARAQDIGEYVRTQTSPEAVFLTGQYANNPFASLGGRNIVLGYTGWLWSYGINYYERVHDVRVMFEHGPAADGLLDKYHIDYLVIGPNERNDKGYKVNESYYRTHYDKARSFGPVDIYDLRKPLVPGTYRPD